MVRILSGYSPRHARKKRGFIMRMLVAAGVIKPGGIMHENHAPELDAFSKEIERVAYEQNVSMETARHVVIHERRFREEVERRKNNKGDK
jgi:hypothetical protein